MASSQNRRVLHQPLPSPQPSPLKPNATPPFFPTDSPPPPFPTPISLPDSSSPVNITSLQRPSSPPPPSHTHLLLIAAAASALILIAASFFYYFRRRNLHRISTNHDKPYRPSSAASAAAAAVYYMNPDAIASRKVDSPELRPLPQLPRRSFTHTYQRDDDDVFYSPKSTGSSSKHTTATVAAAVSAAVGRSMSGSCSSFSSSSNPRSSVTISAHTSPQEKKEHVALSQQPLMPSSSSEEEEEVVVEKTSVPPAPPLKLFRPARAAMDGGGEMGVGRSSEVDTCNKPKLKALHWDKVKATSNREMVWDQLKSSSFKVNEEMMESLFVANSSGSKSVDFLRRSAIPCGSQEMRVLDPKKAQNVSILIRALNVTVEEVREALLEGNEVGLGRELLECLLKMAPTKEEERKLKECNADMSTRLGPAERFLKMIIDIPFAFRRVEALVYVVNFEHEVEYLMMSFKSLKEACEDLKNNRTFLKLLEAVLKTGNRMNIGTDRGEAKAFKLDTLLKLVDVKGVDGKTTLLHFVVKEMIKSEGGGDDRNTGLKLVSSLASELESVKKAAAMDSEVLSGEVRKLCFGIEKIEQTVEMVGVDEQVVGTFLEWIKVFVKMAKAEIMKVEEEERIAIGVVKEITEYFHGNMSREEAHPFRLFVVVRDFLFVLDRVCREMGMIQHNSGLR